jgi:hypothetical protein
MPRSGMGGELTGTSERHQADTPSHANGQDIVGCRNTRGTAPLTRRLHLARRGLMPPDAEVSCHRTRDDAEGFVCQEPGEIR